MGLDHFLRDVVPNYNRAKTTLADVVTSVGSRCVVDTSYAKQGTMKTATTSKLGHLIKSQCLAFTCDARASFILQC
jgi:hypothetical protein